MQLEQHQPLVELFDLVDMHARTLETTVDTIIPESVRSQLHSLGIAINKVEPNDRPGAFRHIAKDIGIQLIGRQPNTGLFANTHASSRMPGGWKPSATVFEIPEGHTTLAHRHLVPTIEGLPEDFPGELTVPLYNSLHNPKGSYDPKEAPANVVRVSPANSVDGKQTGPTGGVYVNFDQMGRA